MIDAIVTFFIEIIFERIFLGIWSLLLKIFSKLKKLFTIKSTRQG